MVNSSRALCTLLSLSVALTLETASPRVAYAADDGIEAPANGTTAAERTIAVVGLDSEDTPRAEALTDALRRAFTVRGYTGGEAVSLIELRLTMGCEEDSPACLAGAGRDLGMKHLLYGYLRPERQGQMQLELKLLDVSTATIEAQVSTTVARDALLPAQIDATASRLAKDLLGEETPEPVERPPRPEPRTRALETPAVQGGQDFDDDSSRFEWGAHRPVARWKWVGFGTSLGLTALAAGAAGGLTWAISNDGPVREDLLEAARASLEDDKPSNDIDPNQPAGVDLCRQARAEPPGEPNTVTNGPVSGVCMLADGLTIGANVAWGVTALGAVSTLVFTTLLFVRKRPPSATARRFTFDAGFGPTGGVVVRGGMRF